MPLVFADEGSESFLEELEALATLQVNDVLQQSIDDYYASNVDIDQGKYPILLHDAAIMGALKLLKYLTKHDHHGVNYAYDKGPTPLGYISGDNQIDSAKILLEAGADPNDAGNTDGVFPLSSAVTSGNMQMVQLLLKHHAEVNIGAYYQSPLGLTLEKNDIETLQLFDTHGFKLDSMNDELRIIVTEYLNSDFVEEEVLRILKIHGFDIYAKTEEKESYFTEYASKIEHADVSKMLQDLYEESTDLEAKAELKPMKEGLEEDASIAESETISDQEETPDGEQTVNLQEPQSVENIEPATTEMGECLEKQDNIVENEAPSAIVTDGCKGGTNSGLVDEVASNKNIDSDAKIDDSVLSDTASANNK